MEWVFAESRFVVSTTKTAPVLWNLKELSRFAAALTPKFTYPLAKLINSAWGGYLWVGYFNGYGEDILDYNQRQHWIARIGYSIAR